jgi:hypothetical protein
VGGEGFEKLLVMALVFGFGRLVLVLAFWGISQYTM